MPKTSILFANNKLLTLGFIFFSLAFFSRCLCSETLLLAFELCMLFRASCHCLCIILATHMPTRYLTPAFDARDGVVWWGSDMSTSAVSVSKLVKVDKNFLREDSCFYKKVVCLHHLEFSQTKPLNAVCSWDMQYWWTFVISFPSLCSGQFWGLV